MHFFLGRNYANSPFDKVDHLGLLSKLEHLGIRGPLLEWTSSFLIGRKQRVVVDGQSSPHSDVLSGVPQGTVLGPLFFFSLHQ